MSCLWKGLSFLILGSCSAYATPEIVKVGVLFSQTGVMADIGAQGDHGLKLALKHLKEKLSNKQYQVEFIYADSRSSPDSAATAVNKLIQRDGVDFIIGDLTSTVTLAAAPLAQTAKIPMLSPSATNDKVTKVGDYIFRSCYIDSFQGIAMANYASKDLKAKTAVLLVDSDMDHSRDVSKIFSETFEKNGGKVLKTIFFSGSHDISLIPQMTQLRKLNADVIYAPVYFTQMGMIFKQAKSFQIKSQFLGTDAWDSPDLFKIAGGATEGGLMTNPFSYQSPEKNVQKFTKEFKSEYRTEPSSYAALSYDSVFLLENALSKMHWPVAQKDLPTAIRNTLAKTKDLDGVTGKITLDSNRNVQKPSVVILKLNSHGYDYHATSKM